MRSPKESNPQRQEAAWGVPEAKGREVFNQDRASASEAEKVLETAAVVAAQQCECT